MHRVSGKQDSTMKKRLLIVTSIYILLIAQEVASFKHLHREKRRGNYDYQSEQQAQQEEQQAQQEEQQAQQEEQQAQQEEQQAQQEEQQAEEEAAQEQQDSGGRYKRSMVHNSDPIWVASPTIQPLNYHTVYSPAVPSSTTQTKTCIEYLRLIFGLLLEDRVNSLAQDTTIIVIT